MKNLEICKESYEKCGKCQMRHALLICEVSGTCHGLFLFFFHFLQLWLTYEIQPGKTWKMTWKNLEWDSSGRVGTLFFNRFHSKKFPHSIFFSKLHPHFPLPKFTKVLHTYLAFPLKIIQILAILTISVSQNAKSFKISTGMFFSFFHWI